MGDFLLLSYTHNSPSLADSNLSVSLSKGERSPKDAGKTGAATGDGGRHAFGIHFCLLLSPVWRPLLSGPKVQERKRIMIRSILEPEAVGFDGWSSRAYCKHGKILSNWSWFCIGGRVTLLSHRLCTCISLQAKSTEVFIFGSIWKKLPYPFIDEGLHGWWGCCSHWWSNIIKFIQTSLYILCVLHINACLRFTATDRKSSQWSQDLRITYTYNTYVYMYICFLVFLVGI